MTHQSKNAKYYILLILVAVFSVCFFIIDGNKPEVKKSDDIEIIVSDINKHTESNEYADKFSVKEKLKDLRRRLHLAVDGYEYEIADFWNNVFKELDYIEYLSEIPAAMKRRLVMMITLTSKEELEEDIVPDKPLAYPDNDFHSMRFRYSIVSGTIDFLKSIIDMFFLPLIQIVLF